MSYINYDPIRYTTLDSLIDLFLHKISGNCIGSLCYNMDSVTNLLEMPNYLRTLYEKNDLKNQCHVVHFSIVYNSVLANEFYYRLNHLIDTILFIKDYFADHPMGYVILAKGNSMELHFIIDQLNVKNGTMLSIDWQEISNFCNRCRTCRCDRFLKMKRPYPQRIKN